MGFVFFGTFFGQNSIHMRAFLLLIILAISCSCLYAAGTDSIPKPKRDYVLQDRKIDWLLNTHRALSEKEGGISGYRVQVFMDSGNQARIKMQRARAEFESRYPGVRVYETYVEPHFRLRVGDFRTRLDARRLMEEIAEYYPPGSVYIVVDTINFPDLHITGAEDD